MRAVLLSALLTACFGMLAPAQAQTVTTLHAFAGGADGSQPNDLVRGTDGSFYGTTQGGDNSDYGTVFRVTPDGTQTILHTFTGGADGRNPRASLVQGTDGSFYGTTLEGGSSDNGTVFRITPSGTLTTLHSFTGGADGSLPRTHLVQGNDSTLYGTTSQGGSGSKGTVFSITPSGTLTTLHAFTGGANGSFPDAGLVQGTDGIFYGITTGGGGTSDKGTVFSITADGMLTTLHTFTGMAEGSYPDASLVQGADGSFYGTTETGGSGSKGTIFSITPSGTLTTLYNFTGTDGYYPTASLVQGTDGSFYGTTLYGGGSFDGTVFRFTLAPIIPAQTWTAVSNATGPDGQTRVLWDGSAGSVSVWTLGTDNSLAAHTDIPGPYAGWTAKAISVDPSNNTHILWTNTDGRMTLWTMTPTGTFIGSYPVFGPYDGWTAQAIASGADGTTHILWDNADGRIAPWTLDANDKQIGSFPLYGPYAGWTAKSISVSPDGNTHILWDNADGRMTPWTLNANYEKVNLSSSGSFPVYGPYAGWTAVGIASDSSNNTHILWNTGDGSIAPWTLDANGQQIGKFPVYGAYTDWTAQAISVGPDGSAHILWDNADGSIAPWTLNADYEKIGSFPIYNHD